jgi:hypothetical protein
MHPTQSGKRMSTGLHGVRKAARERKQERFAARNRKQREEGKPETFTFLGFTHYRGQRHKSGTFTVWRITAKERMVAKLKAIQAELQRRMHARMAEVGAWLRKAVLGYYQYHAVPGNTAPLRIFKLRVRRLPKHLARGRIRDRKSRFALGIAPLAIDVTLLAKQSGILESQLFLSETIM